MLKRVVLLSGPIAAGKTELGRSLSESFQFRLIKTNALLARRLARGRTASRDALQRLGARLDRETRGQWVCDLLLEETSADEDLSVVLDAVRTEEQVEAIRTALGRRVVHVHLTAPLPILTTRYASRQSSPQGEFASYSEARRDRAERTVERLQAIADVVIDTARCTAGDVQVRVASYLNLYGSASARLVDAIVGGQYGSEGKGHVASYLAPEYQLLVRVGGPNAGHKVLQESSQPYTHHLLPSGTLRSSARLLLAPGSVLNVKTLLREIGDCQVEASRLSIDPQAMIIEASDIDKEVTSPVASIGSTMQGVGEATARRITHRSHSNTLRLARDVSELRPYVRPAQEILDGAYSRGESILVEGTQGSGLSLFHGDYPYVTSRDTTVAACLSEAGIAPQRLRRTIAVCRTYPIRVQSPEGGSSGRLEQPLDFEEIARRSGLKEADLIAAERTSTTNRPRRVGEFEWTLLRKMVNLNSPSDIALTFVDYLDKNNELARRFEQLTTGTIHFIEEIERVAHAPVSLISTGFHGRSIIDRRNWRGQPNA